jgi:hypothetical protein
VRAELALVLGRPAEAVAPAEAALAAAGRGGSRRHVLKSRIVLAVARSAAGVMTPAAAVTELDAAAAECAGLGLLPLCWPAGLAALDLTPLPAVNRRYGSTSRLPLQRELRSAVGRTARHADDTPFTPR